MPNRLQSVIDWLSRLDGNLFHWINRDISNPVLDSAMPFVSGNRFFMPVAVVLCVLLVWRGRLRGLLCVGMALLAITIGDGFVARTVKQAVHRSRPPQVFNDVQLRVGNSRSPGFPSSHP